MRFAGSVAWEESPSATRRRELPVEAERDVVRHLGARQLLERRRRRGRAGTRSRARRRGRPRAGRPRPRPPRPGAATNTGSPGKQPGSAQTSVSRRLDVDLDDPLEPAGSARAGAPDVAVGALVAAAVVDPRQLEAASASARLARCRRRADPEAPQLGRGDRLARAQAVEVEVLDDLGVGEGADVDDHLVAVLVGVDVVEAEAGLGRRTAPRASPVARSISVKRVPSSGFQR